jgi:hypothetical protein
MPVEATRAARRLEAAGIDTATFEFRGIDITIPRAIEDWPLDFVRADKPATVVRILLGEQRAVIRERMRTRGDIIELSHRMADACGVTPLPESKVVADAALGAVPTLLDLVDNHGDDLEADLRRFFGVDYRRAPCDGGPTLRQVWVYVRRLPRESALLAARNGGEAPWPRHAVIAAQQWELWTRQRYPGRPFTREEIDEWSKRDAKNKHDLDHMAKQEDYYRSGQNMRDHGLDPGPRAPTQPPHQPQPTQNTAFDRALAVAKKNAQRTPKKGSHDGRRPAQPGQPRGRVKPESGW